MSPPLEPTFGERSTPLALGLEVFDAQRGQRIASRLQVSVENARRTPIPRHSSCQHALRVQPGLRDPLRVRFEDPTRRFVPRILEIPLTPRPVMLQPGFFPGATYPVSERSTGLRGRVVRGPQKAPLRWARVVARRGGSVVGRAHGDDRGEFLLIIDASAASIGPLLDPPLEVTVYGPLPLPPVPSSPALPAEDPLWDLPVEVATATTDDVARGIALPTGYGATATSVRTLTFQLSRLMSAEDFVFSP